MPNRVASLCLGIIVLAAALPAAGHFQELIPSTEVIGEGDDTRVGLDLVFTHPMERGPVMEMAPPVRFGVIGPAGPQDLRDKLQRVTLEGHAAYRAQYAVKAPGDYVFYVEPAPYWEPGEGKWIIHYTKVVVDAFGAQEGWETAVGQPVEIEPLVRPYGLWTGNLFRGIVRQDGRPVPFATVEVEWRNDGSVKAPADPFITQVIKADAGGVFSYAMPRAGWWAFAALRDDGAPLPGPDGKPVPVERGGLIWVRTRDMR